VRRLRPLALRRFKTSLPFLLAIRALKPCVLARRLLFGWNVGFAICNQISLQTKTVRLTARPVCVKKRTRELCATGAGPDF